MSEVIKRIEGRLRGEIEYLRGKKFLAIHREAARGNDISKIETEIDNLSADIWGLTKEELKEIKVSLEELS